jgi:gluconate transporter
MLLLAVLVALVLLIVWGRMTPFIALLLCALALGLGAGLSPTALLAAIEAGVGGTLGGVALVLGLGMVFGQLLAQTGATEVIAHRLVRVFGPQRATWALAITAFVAGIAMFYNAGFVVLAPLVWRVATATGQPVVPLAIAMAAPLSVTHGFLPPHPGVTTVANLLGADLGRTLLLGMVVALPCVVVGGLVFPYFLKKMPFSTAQSAFFEEKKLPVALPPFALGLLVALLPVLLMALGTLAELNFAADDPRRAWAKWLGDPVMAMLVGTLVAWGVLPRSGHRAVALDQAVGQLAPLAPLLLIIAAGGAFKQVLTASGTARQLADVVATWPLSPLVLGWLMATAVRIAVGSATVAAMTTTGLVQPLLAQSGASPELMTLAIGAGSLMCSHVNDSGFWMFRQWFGCSIGDTFRSWTLMETLVGTLGLLMVILLDFLLG